MARDPPTDLMESSSELRDLSLKPTGIHSSKITIVHPQLRDLILPLSRGHVMYPRGQTIEELKWHTEDLDGVEQGAAGSNTVKDTVNTFARLSFTPNCLTARDGILSCGGQHGELYLTNSPTSSQSPNSRLNQRFTTSAKRLRPFELSCTLPTRSINNGLCVLPSYPSGWQEKARHKRAGFIGRRGRMYDNDEEGEDVDRVNYSSSNSFFLGQAAVETQLEAEDEDLALDTEVDEEDEDEELYGDDDDREVIPTSPLSSFSVATYPNTVPFGHAPRIPNLPSSDPMDAPSTSRPSTFGGRDRPPRPSRPSFAASTGQRAVRPSRTLLDPGIQFVTSLPGRTARESLSSPSMSAGPSTGSRGEFDTRQKSGRHPRLSSRPDEPRLLISNNDQTVKMFALRSMEAPLLQRGYTPYSRTTTTYELPSLGGDHHSPDGVPQFRMVRLRADESMPSMTGALPPLWTSEAEASTTRGLATSLGYDTQSYPTGRSGSGDQTRTTSIQFGTSSHWDISRTVGGGGSSASDARSDLSRRRDHLRGELERAREYVRAETTALHGGDTREASRRIRAEYERLLAREGDDLGHRGYSEVQAGNTYSARDRRASGTDEARSRGKEPRRLAKIGGARFKHAINHSSISPDLKTMVSVGDSTDVSLFEIIDGGREFKRVATYSAATDSGFSTSWSSDGRKFAVASQDGQVTVWDHRSSKPLAVFHTSSSESIGGRGMSMSPSFNSDLASSRRQARGSQEHPWEHVGAGGILVDPATGLQSSGTSTSGREAARVVKFSPEGASRDLMVFTEENTHMHIVDARTFNTHAIVPVPFADGETVNPSLLARPGGRSGYEGGTWGLAGVGFDPSGDWLYSGTEKTIVEWDLRRLGGGEGGVWGMA